MKLKILHESNKYNGKYPLRLKNGQSAEAVVEYYQTPKGEDQYEILVYLSGKRVGNFTLGIYDNVAQIDAHVKSKYRRLGIATSVYDLADKIAADLGVTIQPADNISDLGAAFRAVRPISHRASNTKWEVLESNQLTPP